MGVEYYTYAEGKVKGKWHALGGKYDRIDGGGSGHAMAYESWSRSAFREAYDKLREISDGCLQSKEELSEELQDELSFLFEGNGYIDLPIVVDFSKVKKLAPDNVFTNHGFVHKNTITAYNNGDIEYMSPAELAGEGEESDFYALTPEERAKVYEYVEWDEWGDWLGVFKEIKKNVECQISSFLSVNYLEEIEAVRLVVYWT